MVNIWMSKLGQVTDGGCMRYNNVQMYTVHRDLSDTLNALLSREVATTISMKYCHRKHAHTSAFEGYVFIERTALEALFFHPL